MTGETRAPIDHGVIPTRALVVHPSLSRAGRLGEGTRTSDERLAEAVELARALEVDVRAASIAPLRAAAPATLFGKGKLAEIGECCADQDIALVIVDGPLTPVQQRNLERAWGVKVIDRTGLVLEIFARRARTREGRLQVELARLEYERSRLVRTWTHLERQRGGFGFLGGPGETQIEADRRLLLERITRLKSDLAEVRRTRGLQRRSRGRVPFPTIALVGYTNAGKSTLFNRLTKAKVVAADQLFATLDPTMRRMALPEGRPAILSDTVGFISDLPHELVEAFHATLEEVREADVVVHVRDVSSAGFIAEGVDVAKVLTELGSANGDRPIIEAWNKADRLTPESLAEVQEQARAAGAVLISALSGAGCDELRQRLATLVDPGAPVSLRLALGDGEGLAWLYRHGRVRERNEADGAVCLSAVLDSKALGQFELMRPEAFASPSA